MYYNYNKIKTIIIAIIFKKIKKQKKILPKSQINKSKI
jgi:hypothetical protein